MCLCSSWPVIQIWLSKSKFLLLRRMWLVSYAYGFKLKRSMSFKCQATKMIYCCCCCQWHFLDYCSIFRSNGHASLKVYLYIYSLLSYTAPCLFYGFNWHFFSNDNLECKKVKCEKLLSQLGVTEWWNLEKIYIIGLIRYSIVFIVTIKVVFDIARNSTVV